MTIYFARCRGAMKVGFTGDRDPERRLADLNIGNPDPIHLECAIAGDRNDESDLHAAFSWVRLRGEWFYADAVSHCIRSASPDAIVLRDDPRIAVEDIITAASALRSAAVSMAWLAARRRRAA